MQGGFCPPKGDTTAKKKAFVRQTGKRVPQSVVRILPKWQRKGSFCPFAPDPQRKKLMEESNKYYCEGDENDTPDYELNLEDKESVNKKPQIKEGAQLNVLPLRNKVLFPGVLLPVVVGREQTLRLVKESYEKRKVIAVCSQIEPEDMFPRGVDLYTMGTAARILRTSEGPDGCLIVLLEGLERISLSKLVHDEPFIRAAIHKEPEVFPSRNDKQYLATVTSLKELALEVIQRSPELPQEATMALKNLDNPPSLVNYICVNFDFPIPQKQELLQLENVVERADKLLGMLGDELKRLSLQKEIHDKTQENINQQQKEYFLQQEIQTIQRELGDSSEEDYTDLLRRSLDKQWPPEAAGMFNRELKKLTRIPTQSPEYAIQLAYLETLLALPWQNYSLDNWDFDRAQKILDRDHYGMEKVKERILEYMAVLRLRGDAKSPIICLYGPPGVGKTSLGKSIAEALDRQYVRMSLGGLHDEAEIRGHRRTYIGAMLGRVLQNIKKAGYSNPVFVLDEIDKMASDSHGDPTSALLEVLDPEQNTTFHDNYLDVDYDLSKVFFIATANSLSTIPRPLLDRMELIEMTGYLQEEKVEIARKHLIPKVLKANGVKSAQVKFSKAVLNELIDNYTRESGVRELERQITAIVRKVAKHLASGEKYRVSLNHEDLITYLGKPKYTRDQYEGNDYTGVVTGLAWTQVGGEILFIECSLSKSKTPTLTLTGNLGDVMKESATLALGYVKAHAEALGIEQEVLDNSAIHIHVPEGAIPKDGPSAGITMTTALVSALTGRKVRERLAMTGEMTLRGKVLPVGGIKEKILAAKRAGITDLILCQENQKDIAEIPQQYVQGLTFHYVADIDEVLKLALL